MSPENDFQVGEVKKNERATDDYEHAERRLEYIG